MKVTDQKLFNNNISECYFLIYCYPIIWMTETYQFRLTKMLGLSTQGIFQVYTESIYNLFKTRPIGMYFVQLLCYYHKRSFSIALGIPSAFALARF